ncbi:hypothetical protein SAMN02745781_00526 [Vibrio gazogenes DSM 21264]|uniref:Uncharacterized protein n=1 Tax=Vibrio gazogenes DSM 21264 = NBRC 103151 TaxID=1123492 RepID=A0A1M4UPH9_VIBGA|nr:hypothetical protein SAMN02745781_00526 [Vibrio gazogenes DSM 21264] [Vibrio gazogenes DSM 21264 = NBRC 103151]SJN57701.1 hypothetical protein BQ6471_02669 [Vibrio gazogenes]
MNVLTTHLLSFRLTDTELVKTEESPTSDKFYFDTQFQRSSEGAWSCQ